MPHDVTADAELRPEIRSWIESAGLRVKAFYRVHEVASLMRAEPRIAQKCIDSGAIESFSYSEMLPGSHLVRIPIVAIERLAAELGHAP